MRPLTGTRAGRITSLFHALSDPTRVEIIARLARGECCVCDLADTLDAAQPRLSFHLKVLKEAGIVVDRRAGRWVYYSLEPGALADAADFIDRIEERAQATAGAGSCCA